MAGIDYRQLQAPEQVDTSLPDSGNAARLAELRKVFLQVGDVASELHNESATKAGAIAGAAAGNTGHPGYKQGLARLTAYGRAFNNAATGAYAVQSEAQADDAAARLRVEANNDPAHFQATYSAVRDSVVASAPPEARAALMDVYNRRLAAGMAAISGDQATELRNNQRQTYDEGIARQTSRVATLQGSDNPQDQLQAEDEHVKLSLLIDGGVNSGLYSPSEARAMHVASMKQITAQVFETQVDRELTRPDGDVVGLLDRFREAHETNLRDTSSPPVLSEDEYQKLMQGAVTKVREQRLLDMLTKGENKTAEQLKWEAGDKLYTNKLLTGNLTHKELADAVASGDLKPETSRALAVMLSGGPVMKSQPKAYLEALNDPNLPGMSATDIAALPNISNADKIKLGQEAERQRVGWEGTQPVKDAKYAISAALKVPPGSLGASDEEKAAVQNATVDFNNRMAALPPEQRIGQAHKVANDVIRDEHRRITQKQLDDQISFREAFRRRFGPGGSEKVPDDKYNARIKSYDDSIIQLRAQLKD